jgi:uncharacterized protein YcfJ
MKSRMTRFTAPLIAVAALAAAGTASAQRGGYYGDRYEPHYDYARVIDVDPIIDVVDRPVRRDECWEQPVTYREPGYYRGGSRDRTPAVVAGIVGGVIGNQIGSGSGRDAATAAGALLGYTAARDSQRRNGGGYYTGGREYTTYEQRCTTRTDYVSDERVQAYDVTYKYRGRTYHTVTDYHPGDRIRVEVDVAPRP